jgi:hypothetical protein
MPMNENPYDIPGTESVGRQFVPTEIYLSSMAQQFLNQTRPWVRFISVMLFISAGFLILSALIMIGTGAAFMGQNRFSSPMNALGPAVVGGFYLILSLLYIAPGIFLHRYAGTITLLETSRTAQMLEDALKHQKSFWRYTGIVTLIAMILVAILIISSIVVIALIAHR